MDLEDFEGNHTYAKYGDFKVESERNSYQLKKVHDYSGNAGDIAFMNIYCSIP